MDAASGWPRQRPRQCTSTTVAVPPAHLPCSQHTSSCSPPRSALAGLLRPGAAGVRRVGPRLARPLRQRPILPGHGWAQLCSVRFRCMAHVRFVHLLGCPGPLCARAPAEKGMAATCLLCHPQLCCAAAPLRPARVPRAAPPAPSAGMSEAACLRGGLWDLFHFEAPRETAQMLYAQVGYRWGTGVSGWAGLRATWQAWPCCQDG